MNAIDGMRPGVVRLNPDGILVMDGNFASTYRVETVKAIDGNLDSMRARPGHPDIDLLLDARKMLSPGAQVS